MKVFVVEGRKKATRPEYNSYQWKPVDADVQYQYAMQRKKQWVEDHPRQEFRVRPYVPFERVNTNAE